MHTRMIWRLLMSRIVVVVVVLVVVLAVEPFERAFG